MTLRISQSILKALIFVRLEFLDDLEDMNDTRPTTKRERAVFRWSSGSAGSTRSTVQKGIYFGLLTSPNITRAGIVCAHGSLILA